MKLTTSNSNCILILIIILFIINYLPICKCELKCLSNRIDVDGKDLKYSSIEEYTSDMCSQCYSFILPSGLKLKPKPGNSSTLRRPFYYYRVPSTGFLCETDKPRSVCKVLVPHSFNRTHPHVDPVLKTIKTDFHLVSLTLK